MDGKPVTNDAELKSALATVKQRDDKRFELKTVAPDTSSEAEVAKVECEAFVAAPRDVQLCVCLDTNEARARGVSTHLASGPL